MDARILQKIQQGTGTPPANRREDRNLLRKNISIDQQRRLSMSDFNTKERDVWRRYTQMMLYRSDRLSRDITRMEQNYKKLLHLTRVRSAREARDFRIIDTFGELTKTADYAFDPLLGYDSSDEDYDDINTEKTSSISFMNNNSHLQYNQSDYTREATGFTNPYSLSAGTTRPDVTSNRHHVTKLSGGLFRPASTKTPPSHSRSEFRSVTLKSKDIKSIHVKPQTLNEIFHFPKVELYVTHEQNKHPDLLRKNLEKRKNDALINRWQRLQRHSAKSLPLDKILPPASRKEATPVRNDLQRVKSAPEWRLSESNQNKTTLEQRPKTVWFAQR